MGSIGRSVVRRLSASVQNLPSLRQISRGFASGVPERDPRYSTINDTDLTHFRKILGDVNVITGEDALQGYNRDWMNRYFGASRVALRPKSTAQVSEILAHCNRRKLAVVPQGGNTGLVGGGVPLFDEVVLSTAALSEIRSFDPVAGVLVAEAGCILETLDTHLAGQGFTMPLDLGAKGSCHIGGNISTNAGGLRLLRYGSLRGTVLGVEAVLPDGTILDLLQTLRKDNTGYDLKQLFIGGEGTLGVVTAVAIMCPPRPAAVHVAFLSVPDFGLVQQVFIAARKRLGEILSAFEFLDQQALELTLEQLPDVRNPLPDASGPFYLLVETSGSNATHDYEKLEGFLEEVAESGLVEDGVIAQDSTQASRIWALRENVPVAVNHIGGTYKYDISLPTSQMYSLVEETRKKFEDLPVQVVGYGHLGDGNLHLNIAAGAHAGPEVLARIEPAVYEWTAKHRGSISAEHGLGQMKAHAIGYSKAPEAVHQMARLKTLLDPNLIMNPYKFLPHEALDQLQEK